MGRPGKRENSPKMVVVDLLKVGKPTDNKESRNITVKISGKR